jgi:DNA-directed RNA polymerase specialized sigma24 family protein
MYIQKERLKELVIDAQANGISDEFISVLGNIMSGVYRRVPGIEVEDLQQEYFLRIFKLLHKIDAEQDVFSWLTQAAKFVIGRMRSGKIASQTVCFSQLSDFDELSDAEPSDHRAPFDFEYSYPEKKYRGVS